MHYTIEDLIDNPQLYDTLKAAVGETGVVAAYDAMKEHEDFLAKNPTFDAYIQNLKDYYPEEMANASIESVIRSITNACVAWTLFPIICYSYLFFVRRLRARDLFGTWREAPELALFGVKWIWILIPSYALSFILVLIRIITNTHFLPDPFCLIPLALVFGFLYYRTQSILPTIVLHILFNFTSLCLTLLPLFL